MKTTKDAKDAELEAMATVYAVLKGLDNDGQLRVLDYVMKRFSLKDDSSPSLQVARRRQGADADELNQPSGESGPEKAIKAADESDIESSEGLEGISPVAQKWMRRNGLSSMQLSSLFSLGVDEIDLVANSVPGRTIRDKFINVLLLQALAAYLGTGAARVDGKKLRQAAGHYGADPGRNEWKYIKSAAADISGSSSTGFTLTARGLNSATQLIKQMTTASK